MLDSLVIRLWKVPHLARPMVWAPERAVMSRALRPLDLNMEMRVEREAEGGGRLELAALWLAVLESRRPSCTFQEGPPSCTYIEFK